MNDSTRRGFIAMTGAGAAVGVMAVALPTSASAAPSTGADDGAQLPANATGAMAAYIEDVRTGEIVLMVDGHEETIVDKALVARLSRAFVKATRSH